MQQNLGFLLLLVTISASCDDTTGTSKSPADNTLKAQVEITISSYPESEPVPGATLTIPSLDLACHADEAGVCKLKNVPTGNYEFKVAAPEHRPFTDTLNVDRPIIQHDVELTPTDEILVLEGYTATYIDTHPQFPEHEVANDVIITHYKTAGTMEFTYWDEEDKRRWPVKWVKNGCVVSDGNLLTCEALGSTMYGTFTEDYSEFNLVDDFDPEHMSLTVTKN